MGARSPSPNEVRLLHQLEQFSKEALNPDWLDGILVSDMNDGKMGSIKLIVKGNPQTPKIFGKTLSTCQFTDADGVEVIVSLNADSNGIPFEVDFWKVDYSPLIHIPDKITKVED